jgi:hypothetical protein
MSWSIGRTIGRPSEVAASMAEQFARMKKQAVTWSEAELRSIETAEQLVTQALNFNIAQGCAAIAVEASGCAAFAFTTGTNPGALSVSVKVEPLYGFLG